MSVLFVNFYLDDLVTRRLRKEVELLSHEHLFSVCPQCRYDNLELVDSCLKCDYRQGIPIVPEGSEPRFIALPKKDILDEREEYGVHDLGYQLPSKALAFVELDPSEFILIAYKKSLITGLLINGSREVLSYIIFSTKKITLLHYHFDHEGWRFREMIPYENIGSLLVKQRSFGKLPTLIIKTVDSTYELTFGQSKSEMEKIMAIVKCIQKRTLGINVEIEKTEAADKNTDLNTDLNTDVKDLFKSPWQK